MTISIFTVLALIYLLLWIKHLLTKPDLLNVSEHLVTLYFQQLWFFQFIFIIFVIADVFYFLIKDMK